MNTSRADVGSAHDRKHHLLFRRTAACSSAFHNLRLRPRRQTAGSRSRAAASTIGNCRYSTATRHTSYSTATHHAPLMKLPPLLTTWPRPLHRPSTSVQSQPRAWPSLQASSIPPSRRELPRPCKPVDEVHTQGIMILMLEKRTRKACCSFGAALGIPISMSQCFLHGRVLCAPAIHRQVLA